MTELENARAAFLDLLDEADWQEQPDGDIDSSGRMTDCTTHRLIVSDAALVELAEALGIRRRLGETLMQALERLAQDPHRPTRNP